MDQSGTPLDDQELIVKLSGLGLCGRLLSIEPLLGGDHQSELSCPDGSNDAGGAALPGTAAAGN